ncbi:TonB-dependent receptor [Maribacter polysiphoniae]|uniref:Outer membrane receptor protein involved in Fe transport n=1 Tax=Maribacter polysiphoniae TaxID=429344 RepID=A0A316E2Y2_9FLAO|nr:TonB-dependent receptor [Maribacter polysiphoniae]MBD1261030.1 TonB-dependent receptor [Maribacter polysiphoniae]PWK23729.1 outer membrane receptor protein involved in Fe transport [Maribacter polysiphoniae]
MPKVLFPFFLFVVLLAHNRVSAQYSIRGVVEDKAGQPYVGAHVKLVPGSYSTTTNDQGEFELSNLKSGEYLLSISYLGTKGYVEKIGINTDDVHVDIVLKDDILALRTVVVTGTFEPRSKLSSSTAISTLEADGLKHRVLGGTANLLQAIPGTFTDASAGEVFTKVYTRGISASAEDDMGWYYVSLQEDGLPVSLVQHSYYGPDIFHRTDIYTDRVEAIRGGSAAITALNAPGGIYNFISKGPSDVFGGEIRIQGGLQGDNNPMSRIDGRFGGPMGNHWFFNIGGHYRKDEGARNTDFTFSKGGQLRFNLMKKHEKGFIKFYGKLLDDFTNRYTGVAAKNWDDPVAAYGQDFNTTALLMPAFSADVPDGRRLSEGATNRFDPSQGVHAQDKAFGVEFLQDLGMDWSVRFNLKYSHKSANWQTAISNAFVSLDDPLAYFISGAQFPVGQVVFNDAVSEEELARLDNSGILSGESFAYIGTGTLPYDAIMGTASWLKQNKSDEWMNKMTIRKLTDNHDITFGLGLGFSNTSLFTQGSFGYVTYEPNPRMLQVTLENPGQPVIALSDSNGLSNYGGLFFDNARADVAQVAFFANDRWKLSDRLHIDIGLRYESMGHKGSKDQAVPFEREGGYDGNPITDYDNGILMPSGERDSFDFKYDYLSYSTALNYAVNDHTSIFGRFSSGNKAPELNYYFNNFSGVPINQKGQVQEINQLEMGFKGQTNQFSVMATAFWSQLRNIGIADFQFDPDDGSVFYAPVQFNDSRTVGIEWESAYTPLSYLAFTFNGALQNAKATQWTVYDASDSVDRSDDVVLDYSGNTLAFNPKIMFNLGVAYNKDKWNGYYRWHFMGEREGNVANAFQLPAYSIFNTGVGFQINNNLSAHLEVNNLFNSGGLANFYGPNNFGASANSATADYIQANPDASFIVVPVLPRGTYLSLDYKF